MEYFCTEHAGKTLYGSKDQVRKALIGTERAAGHSEADAKKRAKQAKIVKCATCSGFYTKSL